MITQTVKEINNTMTLPRYQSETTTEQVQPSTRKQRAKDGYDYLQVTDLNSDPKTAKILSCRLQPDNFNKSQKLVSLKISIDGGIKIWNVRLNNPNLGVLQNAFGFDENEYVDKKIMLRSEEDEHTGRHMIAVDAVKEEKTKKR